jgi:predicted N-acetyltransferase YhbS
LLGVHPRARGQQIGLQLLAHALWSLVRSSSDLVVIEAAVVRTEFDAVTPEQSPEPFRALCRYYARLGFRRWYTRHKPTTWAGNVMVLELVSTACKPGGMTVASCNAGASR